MENFNKLAARKEIGAIKYRIADLNLEVELRQRIIKRALCSLAEVLPAEFWGLSEAALVANHANNTQRVLDLLAEIESGIILTYGCIPAGTWFVCGDNPTVWIKRKEHVENTSGYPFDHFAADRPVTIINGEALL